MSVIDPNDNQINELLIKHKNNSCDIYAIATQESQRSILMNLLFWDKNLKYRIKRECHI